MEKSQDVPFWSKSINKSMMLLKGEASLRNSMTIAKGAWEGDRR